MKRSIVLYLSAFCISGLLLSSCKTPAITSGENTANLPNTFPAQSSSDTISAASMSWKSYYKDPQLIALIEKGLQNNLDLKQFTQRMKTAEAEWLRASGAMRPTVQPMLTTSLRRFGLYTMDGAGNIVTDIVPGKIVPIDLPDYWVAFQSSWEADLWGKLKNRKKAAIAQFFASREGKNLFTTILISEIASAYFTLQSLDETIQIIDNTIQLQEQAFEVIKIQKQAAAATELAVKQFEAQLLNTKALRWEIVTQQIETENLICQLIGGFPEKVLRGSQFFLPQMEKTVNVGIPSLLLEKRPDIRQASFQVAAAKMNAEAARKAFLPSFQINAMIGFQAFRPDLLFRMPESIAYGLIGGLTAPLVNKAAIKAQFEQANAYQLEVLYQYQYQVIKAYTEVYNEMIRLKNLDQAFELKKREVETSLAAVDISRDLFRTARAGYIEILYAQQGALQTQLQLVDNRRKQLLAKVHLYRALGGGWDETGN